MLEPTIFAETERLWLRRFNLADLHPFIAMRGNPVVARYQSWSTFTEEDGYWFIQEMEQSQPGVPGDWYQFAVALRSSNEFIGDCALYTNDDGRSGDIGYTFAPAYQGRGYATEAVTAVIHYAYQTLNLHQFNAFADSRNTASIALLERLHFQRQKEEAIWFKEEWAIECHYSLSLTHPLPPQNNNL